MGALLCWEFVAEQNGAPHVTALGLGVLDHLPGSR
jgi:hypothetical protein